MSEVGWPRAHPGPAVAGGRGRGGRLPARSAPPTREGGADPRAPGCRGPATRSNSVAYRSLSRQLGKNQNHRQQKKGGSEKTAYFQK